MARKKRTLRPVDPDGYSYEELLPLVGATLRAGLSVLLRGHPGVGKSALAHEVAAELGLPIIDIRLAQRDPAELGGVYFPDRDRQVLSLLPPEWVRRACDEPVMVFLDEINAATTRLHQAAAYQIVLERRVGPFCFHPRTVVLAAGNLEDDGPIVTSLSSALRNRFVHFTLRVDAANWLTWAARSGVDEAIMAFIGHRREPALYGAEDDDAFPTPRSWAMGSKAYQAVAKPLQRRALAACVGVKAAERLFTYLRLYRRVGAASIVRRGKAMDFTTERGAEPSFIFAAVYAVAAWLKKAPPLSDTQLRNVARFLQSPGLDPEFVVLFLRQLDGCTELLARLDESEEVRQLKLEFGGVDAELVACV